MMSLKNKLKLAVLISNAGTGTNLQAIIDGVEKGEITGEISAVISNREDALGLERAKKHGLSIEICKKKEELLSLLRKLAPDYICLAGWKQIILDEVILVYPNKILNLHPGLIPDTINGSVENPDGTDGIWNKGKLTDKAIQNFLDQKATFVGSSIHFLTLHFDFGPVLGRCFEKIESSDNVKSLYERLKKKENQLYVEVLKKLTSPPAPLLNKERVAESRMRYKKILIIGSGGREHAVGWKTAQSPKAGEIFFAPGNAGTATIGTNVDIKATDILALKNFVQEKNIDLTLALPDDPLSLGIVDEFRKEGLRIWGPTQVAAKLEWSKAYAKDFMKQNGLPTARFEIFSDYETAKKYLEKQPLPVVVKVSGLALGKGVFICDSYDEADEALKNILMKETFGQAGREVVIEEFLEGPEISIHVFSDGENYSIFPFSQDHKRIGEGDTGLNTGGMGTIAPIPFASNKLRNPLLTEIEQKIVKPTLDGMRALGASFQGVLYPGLILTKDGPKILEYNARLGDPETQSYMRLLKTDLLDIVDACIDGKLDEIELKWSNQSVCTIVLASAGYPGDYEKGKVVSGIEEAEKNPGVKVFHAGTKLNQDGKIVTNGGRVLGISATGKNLKEALQTAYETVSKIKFEGMQYRRDIGQKSILV